MDPLFSATKVFQDSHGRLVYVLCIGFIILEFLFVFESKTDFFLRWYCVKELVWLWKGCICFWKEKKLWAESEFMQRFNGLYKFQYRVIGFYFWQEASIDRFKSHCILDYFVLLDFFTYCILWLVFGKKL